MNWTTKVGNLEASTLDSLLKRSHKTGTTLRIAALKALVLSQEDKPKRHQSAR